MVPHRHTPSLPLQNQLDESQQERNDLMQLKLQLEDQVTELRSRVQELETALATARQEHSELTEQYKVGLRAGGGRGLDLAKRRKERCR